MAYSQPARTASYIGCTGIAALSDGAWNHLASGDFQNVAAATATNLPANLRLVSVTVQVDAGTAECFARLYHDHVPAGVTTNFPKAPAGSALILECRAVWEDTNNEVLGVSVYKTATATGRVITFWENPLP